MKSEIQIKTLNKSFKKNAPYGYVLFHYHVNKYNNGTDAIIMTPKIKDDIKKYGYRQTLKKIVKSRNLHSSYDIKNVSINKDGSFFITYNMQGRTSYFKLSPSSNAFTKALNSSIGLSISSSIISKATGKDISFSIRYNNDKPYMENLEFSMVSDNVYNEYPVKENDKIEGYDNINQFFQHFEKFSDYKTMQMMSNLLQKLEYVDDKHVLIEVVKNTNSKKQALGQTIADGNLFFTNSYNDLQLDEQNNVIFEKQLTPNSCLYHLITKNYKHIMKLKNKKEEEIYLHLYQIANDTRYNPLTEDRDFNFDEIFEWSLSFTKCDRIFEYLGVKYIALDAYENIVHRFTPTKLDTHVSPKTLYFQVINNHCNEIKNHLIHHEIATKKNELIIPTPSENFYIRPEKENKKDKPSTVLISSFADIKQILNQKNVNVISNIPILELIDDIIHIGILPQIKMNNFFISSLVLPNKITIKNFTSSYGNHEFKDETEYERFIQLDEEFNKVFLNKHNLSYYNEQTQDILNMTRGSSRGIVNDFSNVDSCLEIDFNKQFTSVLLDEPQFPIIDVFDYFQDYNNEPIEDYNIYIVYNEKEVSIFLNKDYSLVFGKNLRQYKGKYTITQFIRTRQVNNITSSTIKKIYEDDVITNDQKKYIINLNIGKCGKYENSHHRGTLFTREEECNTYLDTYGGEKSFFKSGNKTYYYHYLGKSSILKNGFKLIQLLIHDSSRMQLYKLEQELKNNNILSYACNTDCVYIPLTFLQPNQQKSDLDEGVEYKGVDIEQGIETNYQTSEILNIIKSQLQDETKSTFENIGKVKTTVKKCLIFNQLYKEQENFYKPVDTRIQKIQIEDEYDTNEIVSKLKTRTIIRAKYAGCGKSYSLQTLGENILFVSPTNQLRLDILQKNIDCITVSQLIGECLTSNDDLKQISEYDISKYKYIALDEINMYNINQLRKLNSMIDKYSDKIFVATGDKNQLETINEDSKYVQQCINIMFRHEMKLTEIKRLNSNITHWQGVYDKLKKGDLSSLFAFNVIRDFNQIKTKKNICFTHDLCDKVNRHIFSLEYPDKEYDELFEGLKIRSTTQINKKGLNIYRNFNYEVVSFDASSIIITDILKNEYTITYEILKNCFTKTYANTCHSIQGTTINEPTTIFIDFYARKNTKWIYTAITRLSNPELINIFYVKNTNEKPNSTVIQNRIDLHKKSDMVRFAYDEEDFIDVDFVNTLLDKTFHHPCLFCGTTINAFNWSIDRKSNDLPHLKQNCHIICRKCNCTRK